MITKWYKSYLAGMISAISTSTPTPIQIKKPNGNMVYIGFPSSSSAGNCFPFMAYSDVGYSDGARGIWLGNGTTTPTEEDYNMQNQITSGISCSTSKTNGVDENGNAFSRYIITVTNTSSSAKTISEIAFAQGIPAASSPTGSVSWECIMLDHTLLDSPVTIAAGDVAVIEYTLKCALQTSA